MPFNFEIENNILLSFSYTSKKEVKNITIPDGVVHIDEGVFYCTCYINAIKFPLSLKTIGTSAFSVNDIKTIVIPPSVTDIGNCAFSTCNKLKSVILPSGITSISEGAFCDVKGKIEINTFFTQSVNEFQYCG